MKQVPLHMIVSRLRRMPLHEQVDHLRKLVALERPYSVRRNELESMLSGKILNQLRREGRAA
jgi:hypothetical protein